MPEIDICRSCKACADFTPIEELFLDRARVLNIAERRPDDVFLVRLEIAERESRNRKLRHKVKVLGSFSPRT